MEPLIATVSQLNSYMKRLVEAQQTLGDIWIKGEISNFKEHYSGHLYITLKDDGGVLKAVMFKSAAQTLTFRPEDGMKVLARGRIGVYEQSGTYQLYINEMTPDGVGELYIAYEKLKKRLAEEGLFDDSAKKPIPKYPEKIGVVTATTGAAVRDIINVITRRYPYCEIIIYPSLVQGAGAKENIVEAIEYFNKHNLCDTLIVGRGGGSIEDLWAFNEEEVARAIYASKIPIISAVGHETDFTIADFVADLRAPTPSAAAEIAVPSQLELSAAITGMQGRLKTAQINYIKRLKLSLDNLKPKSPQNLIDDMRQKCDNLMHQAEKSYRLTEAAKRKIMSELCAKLDAMSPLAVLKRGYAIAEDGQGGIIKEVKNLKTGEIFKLTLSDGSCKCEVKEKINV
ncbi:MAG TPA: exodeoxyribonuclease VII large subunit [Clostridiales bacterium]|nr:exodeoxyribonuclease VII large subunit [Clostridiales bacterium]